MHAVAAASSDPLPPPGAALLAPGFRFHPTDEELVSYYLTRRVRGRAVRVDAIAEVDIYKCEPWELPGLSRLRSRDLEWYFFSPLDRKYASRSRTNRSTAQGYWKTTGKDRPVRRAGRTVGMKKTLVYHSGRAPHGARTNWVMHEYRLEEDEAAQSRLPQDGYVVCRIFQKTGSGPQNGAQYGAPFIEEEWEEDETINEALVLMPDSGDDEINNHAHDKDFLEVNDFLQTEGIGGQKEGIAATFLVGTNEKSSGNYAEDPVVFLDEMLKDPSFIDDMVDYNSQAQINSRPTCPDDFGEQVLLKDSIRDSPNKNDGYLEFSGTEDAINTDHSNVGYLSYPLRTSHALNFGDGEGESRNLQKDLDAEFLDNADSSCDPDEMVRMTLVDDCLDQRTTVPLDFSSRSFCQSVQDLVFCDVCGDDVAPEPSSLNDQNRVLSPPISDLPAFDFDDELMAYFDAMDDNLQFDISGFSESFEQRNSPILDQSNSKAYIAKGFDNAAIPQLSNADLVAGASSILPLSDNQLEDKHEEILVGPGATVNIEDKEAITNRLVNFLGSISAPPAFASEFPAGQEKYFEQLAGTYEGSLLNVSPSLVPLHDFTATSGTEDWLLRKHGNTGLLLSYSIADNVSGKTSCFGPLRKLQEWTTSLMLRCGFYPFFLSGLVLTVSYKVGMCLYGKNS